MRIFHRHEDSLVNLGRLGKKPTIRITLRFILRDGTRQALPVSGLLDTGASISVLPGYLVGLSPSRRDSITGAEDALESTIAAGMDFQPVELSGLFGSGRAPGYRAEVSIAGISLEKEIVVAAVAGLWEPLIGRDVLDQFLITIDPWKRTSALANKHSGKALSWGLGCLKGKCVNGLK